MAAGSPPRLHGRPPTYYGLISPQSARRLLRAVGSSPGGGSRSHVIVHCRGVGRRASPRPMRSRLDSTSVQDLPPSSTGPAWEVSCWVSRWSAVMASRSEGTPDLILRTLVRITDKCRRLSTGGGKLG